MGLPILNMDGYLLKKIKEETARANAADAELQRQITALSNDAIVAATANIANGWRMIDADELKYWTGSSDLTTYPMIDLSIPPITFNGFSAVKGGAIGGVSRSFPWSQTEFNKGQPYLAVIGYQTAVKVDGYANSYFETGVEISYIGAAESFLPAYTHTQKTVTNARLSFCDMIGFSPVVYVDKAGINPPFGVTFFAKRWSPADSTYDDLTVTCYNPYDSSLNTANRLGLNLYVNFPKTTE